MTKIDALSLFGAMDLAADMIRATVCDYSPADDQIIFRKLQKQRLPTLTPEQFQSLYDEWMDHYRAKCAQDRKRTVANIVAIGDEFAKTNPPALFKCVCGVETKDPTDPEFMAIHMPHCQQAGEERIARELRERSARPG